MLVGFPLALFRRSVWLLCGVIYNASYCVLGSTAPIKLALSGAGVLAAVSIWSHLCPACYEWASVLPVVCALQPQQHRCKRQGVHISRSLGWSAAAAAKAPSFLPGLAGLRLIEVRPLLRSSTLRSLEKLWTSLATCWQCSEIWKAVPSNPLDVVVFAMVVVTRGQDEGFEEAAAVTPFVKLSGSRNAGVANTGHKHAKSWQKRLDAVNALWLARPGGCRQGLEHGCESPLHVFWGFACPWLVPYILRERT